jgi:hypothetical protein
MSGKQAAAQAARLARQTQQLIAQPAGRCAATENEARLARLDLLAGLLLAALLVADELEAVRSEAGVRALEVAKLLAAVKPHVHGCAETLAAWKKLAAPIKIVLTKIMQYTQVVGPGLVGGEWSEEWLEEQAERVRRALKKGEHAQLRAQLAQAWRAGDGVAQLTSLDAAKAVAYDLARV